MQGKSKLRSLAGSALRAQPDRRLVRLAREGHGSALEEIVRRYRPALVGFAARIVPPHRAEDVVQESLARAMIALVESDRELKLKPWLYAIVRNRALNDRRDERLHEQIPDDFDGVPQPPDVIAGREELASLVGAIGELPTGQREALVQRELEGRSHEEIADRLGSTPGAVRGLIFRARVSLRDAAGFLVPLPLVRWLLAEGTASGAMVGSGAAAAGGAAATGAAAGGGGVAAKTGAAVLIASLALGSGVALRDEGRDAGAEASSGGNGQAEDAGESAGGSGSSPGSDGSHGGPGPSSSSGPSERSGPGDGDGEDDRGDDDSSGPGPGGERDDHDNSGPSHGGEDDDGDSSGPGPGGDPELQHDNSGPGGGGGSGHGGSGSSGSGSSGSGSSGSGSGSSGSGGSGSSGSGSSGSGSGSSGSDGSGSGSGGSGSDERDPADD